MKRRVLKLSPSVFVSFPHYVGYVITNIIEFAGHESDRNDAPGVFGTPSAVVNIVYLYALLEAVYREHCLEKLPVHQLGAVPRPTRS